VEGRLREKQSEKELNRQATLVAHNPAESKDRSEGTKVTEKMNYTGVASASLS